MSCLIRALASVLIAAGFITQASPAPRHFSSSKECNFEFDYPGDWVVTPSDETIRCGVTLRPGDFANKMKEEDVDIYTLYVTAEHGDFLAIAADKGFDFVKGKWVLLGRQSMTTDAQVVATALWHGLRGVAATGCFSESRGHAGLCERPALLLRDDDDNIWSMSGGPQSEAAFDTILASFRFRRQ